MQVACSECSDEITNPYAIGYQLDKSEVDYGKGYDQLVKRLVADNASNERLEITGKYFLNEKEGVGLAESRAEELAERLRADLQLKHTPLLRSQKVWQLAPTQDTFFQAIDLQWIPAPSIALERVIYPLGDLDEMKMTQRDRSYLKDLVELLKADSRKVEVIGHTDDRGGPVHNQRVGAMRARMVVDALTELGMPSDRITWLNAQDSEPLMPNTSEANRAKNRRVYLKVIP